MCRGLYCHGGAALHHGIASKFSATECVADKVSNDDRDVVLAETLFDPLCQCYVNLLSLCR